MQQNKNSTDQFHCELCGQKVLATGLVAPTTCDSCAQQMNENRRDDADLVAPMNVVGPVYWEEGDRFLDSISDALDFVEREAGAENLAQQTLWLCQKTETKLDLTVDDILGDWLSFNNIFEDAEAYFGRPVIQELQALLDAWCAKYAAFTCSTHRIDHERRVDLGE